MRRTLRWLVVALALLAAGALAPPATAAVEPADVAAALQRSPVYIDDALDGEISPTAARRLAREAERSGREVYVALVRLEEGDRFGGKARDFLAAVRSRLGRDGTFVVADDGYLTVERYRDGQRLRDEATDDATTLANFADRGEPGSADRTLLARTERLLANLRESPSRLAARVAAYEREQEARASSSASTNRSGGSESGGSRSDGLYVLAGVLLLTILVVACSVRRSRRGARAAHGPLPVVPDRVFEHALAAQRAELHDDADEQLVALATLLDEQPVPEREDAQDAYQRALDAYTAARRRAVEDAPTVDLVGVLVLVDQARGDLARAAALDARRRAQPQAPLCAFHPLHGRSVKTVRWERGLKVPACADCAAAVRSGRTPDALRDGDRPYFEGETVWARTGYGAFSDDLVERVARGER